MAQKNAVRELRATHRCYADCVVSVNSIHSVDSILRCCERYADFVDVEIDANESVSNRLVAPENPFAYACTRYMWAFGSNLVVKFH